MKRNFPAVAEAPLWSLGQDGTGEALALVPPVAEARGAGMAVAATSPPRPFVVVGMPRTGSSLLLTGIRQHPSIAAHGELFHRDDKERSGPHAIVRGDARVCFDAAKDDAITFIKEEVLAKAPAGIHLAGFKLHREFVAGPGTRALLRRLKSELPQLSVVHIVRRNYLDVLVSRRVAEATGRWHQARGGHEPPPRVPRIRIDPAAALRFFDSMDEADRTFESVFGDGAYLQLSHEALSRDYQSEMKRVYAFLGVEPHEVEAQLEKQITVGAEEIVENLDELRRFFAPTAYAPFFDRHRRRLCFVSQATMRIDEYRFDMDSSGAVRHKFSAGRDFILMKRPKLIEEYERVLKQLRPHAMMELGIRRGGSMAMFNLAFRPPVHLAIEIEETPIPALDAVAQAAADEGRKMVPVFGVDQSDKARLVEIVRTHVNADPRGALDLVIDDASHKHELSRISFETLFPCIRTGGIYALEDWGWAHWAEFQGDRAYFAKEDALTNLVFALLILHTCRPDIIASIRVTPVVVFIERGSARLDPMAFRIAEHMVMRGRTLTPI